VLRGAVYGVVAGGARSSRKRLARPYIEQPAKAARTKNSRLCLPNFLRLALAISKIYEHLTMALTKPSKSKMKAGASKKTSKPSTNGGISKRKAKQAALAKPGGPQKTKPSSATQPKKKKKVYTEKELGIPKLNMIVPAGVQKPKGKKKGKIFVDDQESMMTILAMVNADKEGQIESKMMKAVS